MREMKDSGIEWIKQIPTGWSTTRGKNILQLMKRPPEADDEVITCFRDGEVTLRRNRREEGFTFSDKEIGYQGIKKGDLVIHGMDGFAGAIGISDSDGKGSPVLVVCTTKENARYLVYYLRTLAMQDVFLALATGIRERSCDLRWNKIADLLFPVPALNEQCRIADYLDRKCSQIDAIIARQQEVIDKLKAYKLSVITEAVTKGLNPDVPMKNSGVEWIGEIPEHWKVCRLKNVLQQIKNAVKVGPFGSQLKTNDYVDAGYWVYTQRTVLDKNFDSNDTFISCEKYRDMEGFKVEADDILITTRGTGTTGHIAKVPQNFFEGILHPCLMRIKLDESICKYDYLFYLFEYASFIRNQIDFASNTSSLPVLYSYTLNNIWITLPSVNEQLQIATALNEVAAKIDNIIIKRQQVIDSLIDYKKSLIYEVVTGKKEV